MVVVHAVMFTDFTIRSLTAFFISDISGFYLNIGMRTARRELQLLS
jgi:hypothetical protein